MITGPYTLVVINGVGIQILLHLRFLSFIRLGVIF